MLLAETFQTCCENVTQSARGTICTSESTVSHYHAETHRTSLHTAHNAHRHPASTSNCLTLPGEEFFIFTLRLNVAEPFYELSQWAKNK